MRIAAETTSTLTVIRLEEGADISCAAELRQSLAEALADAREVKVELSGSGEIDLAIVQLLWAAGREARAAGGSLTVETAGLEALRGMLGAAGLAELPCSLKGA